MNSHRAHRNTQRVLIGALELLLSSDLGFLCLLELDPTKCHVTDHIEINNTSGGLFRQIWTYYRNSDIMLIPRHVVRPNRQGAVTCAVHIRFPSGDCHAAREVLHEHAVQALQECFVWDNWVCRKFRKFYIMGSVGAGGIITLFCKEWYNKSDPFTTTDKISIWWHPSTSSSQKLASQPP